MQEKVTIFMSQFTDIQKLDIVQWSQRRKQGYKFGVNKGATVPVDNNDSYCNRMQGESFSVAL